MVASGSTNKAAKTTAAASSVAVATAATQLTKCSCSSSQCPHKLNSQLPSTIASPPQSSVPPESIRVISWRNPLLMSALAWAVACVGNATYQAPEVPLASPAILKEQLERSVKSIPVSPENPRHQQYKQYYVLQHDQQLQEYNAYVAKWHHVNGRFNWMALFHGLFAGIMFFSAVLAGLEYHYGAISYWMEATEEFWCKKKEEWHARQIESRQLAESRKMERLLEEMGEGPGSKAPPKRERKKVCLETSPSVPQLAALESKDGPKPASCEVRESQKQVDDLQCASNLPAAASNVKATLVPSMIEAASAEPSSAVSPFEHNCRPSLECSETRKNSTKVSLLAESHDSNADTNILHSSPSTLGQNSSQDTHQVPTTFLNTPNTASPTTPISFNARSATTLPHQSQPAQRPPEAVSGNVRDRLRRKLLERSRQPESLLPAEDVSVTEAAKQTKPEAKPETKPDTKKKKPSQAKLDKESQQSLQQNQEKDKALNVESDSSSLSAKGQGRLPTLIAKQEVPAVPLLSGAELLREAEELLSRLEAEDLLRQLESEEQQRAKRSAAASKKKTKNNIKVSTTSSLEVRSNPRTSELQAGKTNSDVERPVVQLPSKSTENADSQDKQPHVVEQVQPSTGEENAVSWAGATSSQDGSEAGQEVALFEQHSPVTSDVESNDSDASTRLPQTPGIFSEKPLTPSQPPRMSWADVHDEGEESHCEDEKHAVVQHVVRSNICSSKAALKETPTPQVSRPPSKTLTASCPDPVMPHKSPQLSMLNSRPPPSVIPSQPKTIYRFEIDQSKASNKVPIPMPASRPPPSSYAEAAGSGVHEASRMQPEVANILKDIGFECSQEGLLTFLLTNGADSWTKQHMPRGSNAYYSLQELHCLTEKLLRENGLLKPSEPFFDDQETSHWDGAAAGAQILQSLWGQKTPPYKADSKKQWDAEIIGWPETQKQRRVRPNRRARYTDVDLWQEDNKMNEGFQMESDAMQFQLQGDFEPDMDEKVEVYSMVNNLRADAPEFIPTQAPAVPENMMQNCQYVVVPVQAVPVFCDPTTGMCSQPILAEGMQMVQMIAIAPQGIQMQPMDPNAMIPENITQGSAGTFLVETVG